MKKFIKYTLLTVLGAFIGLVLLMALYPFWMMQPMPRPKQPELSSKESIFFKQIEQELNVQVDRMIENKEELNCPLRIDTSFPYTYSFHIIVNDSMIHDKSFTSKIANCIKDTILENSENLKNIYISWKYLGQSSEYFFFEKDSISGKLIQTR